MKLKLPALNVQFPISKYILDGSKTVETRTYPLPSQYLGKNIFIVETPGKSKEFEARVVGIICILKSFKYENKYEFYKDVNRHLIDEKSVWAWTADKPKWGWELRLINKFSAPFKAPKKRGIVFTKIITIENY